MPKKFEKDAYLRIHTDQQGQGIFSSDTAGNTVPISVQREVEGKIRQVEKIDELMDIQEGESIRVYSRTGDSSVLTYAGNGNFKVDQLAKSPYGSAVDVAANQLEDLWIGAKTGVAHMRGDEEGKEQAHKDWQAQQVERAMDKTTTQDSVPQMVHQGVASAIPSLAISGGTLLGTRGLVAGGKKLGAAMANLEHAKPMMEAMSKMSGNKLLATMVTAGSKRLNMVPGSGIAKNIAKKVIAPDGKFRPEYVAAIFAEMTQVQLATMNNVYHQNIQDGVAPDESMERAMYSSLGASFWAGWFGRGGALGGMADGKGDVANLAISKQGEQGQRFLESIRGRGTNVGLNQRDAQGLREGWQEFGQEGGQALAEQWGVKSDNIDPLAAAGQGMIGAVAGHATGKATAGQPDINEEFYSRLEGEKYQQALGGQVMELAQKANLPPKQLKQIKNLVEESYGRRAIDMLKKIHMDLLQVVPEIDENLIKQEVEEFSEMLDIYEDYRTSGKTLEEYQPDEEQREVLREVEGKVLEAAAKLKEQDPDFLAFSLWAKDMEKRHQNKEQAKRHLEMADRLEEHGTPRDKEKAKELRTKAKELDPSVDLDLMSMPANQRWQYQVEKQMEEMDRKATEAIRNKTGDRSMERFEGMPDEVKEIIKNATDDEQEIMLLMELSDEELVQVLSRPQEQIGNEIERLKKEKKAADAESNEEGFFRSGRKPQKELEGEAETRRNRRFDSLPLEVTDELLEAFPEDEQWNEILDMEEDEFEQFLDLDINHKKQVIAQRIEAEQRGDNRFFRSGKPNARENLMRRMSDNPDDTLDDVPYSAIASELPKEQVTELLQKRKHKKAKKGTETTTADRRKYKRAMVLQSIGEENRAKLEGLSDEQIDTFVHDLSPNDRAVALEFENMGELLDADVADRTDGLNKRRMAKAGRRSCRAF